MRDLKRDEDDTGATSRIEAVRRAINEFRDDRGAGLIRLRLDLRRWETLLGIVIYALFALAVLSLDRDRLLVQSFAAYYLVGAAAGLMVEVWRRRTNRPVVEDYGLIRARLRLAPLLSGAAACAGAFIVGLLTDNTLTEVLTAGVPSYERLVLVTNPALVIVAAAFGLAPGRLLGTVQGIGDKLARDLSASEPTGAGDDDRAST
jgi:hypothetical protein